jgi:hypothetical protein
MKKLVTIAIAVDERQVGGTARTLLGFRQQSDEALAQMSLKALKNAENELRTASAKLASLAAGDRHRLMPARELVGGMLPCLIDHMCAEYVLALRQPKDLPVSLFAGAGEPGEVVDNHEDDEEDEEDDDDNGAVEEDDEDDEDDEED